LGEDGGLAVADLVSASDLVGDELGDVGVDDLLDLQGEHWDDEGEEQQRNQRDQKAQENRGPGHRPLGDAAGAAGGELVVGGEPAIDDGGGEEGGDRERVGRHRGGEVGEDFADLADVKAVLGEGAEQRAKRHNAGQRAGCEQEDAQQVP
jgi:hypothetical protein